MFHSVLICTDLTDSLSRLVNFVPDLAKGGLKRIVFLHAISVWKDGSLARVDEGQIAQVKEQLAPALQSIPNGVEVKVEVLSGKIIENILRLIETEKIEVILTGTPIRSAIESRIFGSTTLELARLTPVPLMILRPQLISTYTSEELSLRCQHLWRYVLIPYNDGESAQYLLKHFIECAQQRPTHCLQRCYLLWVVDNGRRQAEITQYHLSQAREKLSAIKTQLENLNVAVETEVRQGNPLQEILATALTHDISAIAVGNNRSTLSEWTVPSLANDILSRSWFPLLYFSPKK